MHLLNGHDVCYRGYSSSNRGRWLVSAIQYIYCRDFRYILRDGCIAPAGNNMSSLHMHILYNNSQYVHVADHLFAV